MVDKVNGGVKKGFWTEGAVAFYTVDTVPALADVVAVDGVSVVPNSTLDKIIQVVGEKAVVIGVEYAEGGTDVLLALTRSGWTAADMQTAIRALGNAVTVNKYTSGASDVITTTTVDLSAVKVTTGADFVGSAVASL